ncbi:MAG: hypothetical protein R3350_02845 [Saprospiraceae bacterium]|nr:hypothetical protein [Saprospiraceae bacterium]
MKTKPNHRFILWALFIALLAAACASPLKLAEQGNYDRAVDLAIRKLAGKKNKKAKYVEALEMAFTRAVERDMQRAERLKEAGSAADWERVHGIYRGIRERQEAIRPLLPLIDKEGVKAEFRFVRTASLEREARRMAAQRLYEEALVKLERARAGDRLAARTAYGQLERIDRYDPHFRDSDQLMQEAKQLGTTHVLFTIENRSGMILPQGLQAELERLDLYNLDRKWKAFHLTPGIDIDFDYQVVMRIDHIDIGPDLIRERLYEEEREIEDGFDYVLDENGNVMKDSLGNDIVVPRMVRVRAEVLETYQSKVAGMQAQLEIFDERARSRVFSQPITAEAVFEHASATYRGDKRALSKEARRYIGISPVPFPSDEGLLLDLADRIKPVLKSKVRDMRMII